MAATVTNLSTYRKQNVTHYAILIVNGDHVYGTAELLNGSEYLFRAEGERKATLVSYKDPALTLLGRCDLADAQREEAEAAGGLAALVCGYGKGR
jgi:hypothetical protein